MDLWFILVRPTGDQNGFYILVMKLMCMFNETDMHSFIYLHSWVFGTPVCPLHHLHFATLSDSDLILFFPTFCKPISHFYALYISAIFCYPAIQTPNSTSSWPDGDPRPSLHLLHLCPHQRLVSEGSCPTSTINGLHYRKCCTCQK